MPLFELQQVHREPRTPFEVRIERTTDEECTIHRWCAVYKKPAKVEELSYSAVIDWALGEGELVQDAFPELSAADREIIISGAHGECFDEEFPPEKVISTEF